MSTVNNATGNTEDAGEAVAAGQAINNTANTSSSPLSTNSNNFAANALLPGLQPAPPPLTGIATTATPLIAATLTPLPTTPAAPSALASSHPTGFDNTPTAGFDPNILASFPSAVPTAFPTAVLTPVPSIDFSSVSLSAASSAVPFGDNPSFTSIPPQPSHDLQTSTVLPGSFLPTPTQQQQQQPPPLSTMFSVPSPSAVPTTTNTASPVQPYQQQQQQSASDKFLQEQLDAQKAASNPGGASPGPNKQPQVQRAALPKKQQQQQQKLAQPPQPPQPSVPTIQQPGLLTPQISAELLAMITGTALPPSRPPVSSSQQLQHDLQQLQLHRERQAAEEAALAQATRALKVLLGNGGNVIPGTQIPISDISDEMISQALSTLGESGDIADLTTTTSAVPDTANNVIMTTAIGSEEIKPATSTATTATASSNSTADVSGSSSEATPAAISTPPQIFKATYSGVPVFEMICKGVAVMRRRSDSYLNATQILKVAEFDKPQRTRILEREVQKGEHEKVQGGYGKYQGTWVPYERGLQLCQEYNVLEVLQPLLNYQTRANSPPLAPKHITAATNRPRKPKEPRVPGAPKTKKSKTQRAPKPGAQGSTAGATDQSAQDTPMTMEGDGDDNTSASEVEDQDEEMPSRAGSEGSMDETMSILSGQSRSPTPSPLESRAEQSYSEVSDNEAYSPGLRRQRSAERSPRSRKKQNIRPGDELFIGYNGGHDRQSSSSQQQSGYPSPGGRSRRRDHSDQDVEMRSYSPSIRHASPGRRRGGQGGSRTKILGDESWQDSQTSKITASESTQSQYAETLLEYFVTDQTTLPSILTHPPPDLDFDLIIDEEGHTPLHWAVAMARIKIVKLLVQHGADIYRVNNQGQTALMRSVLFANNFDMKTFASLLEVLQKTIFTIDKNDQTVFHHVAATAGMRGKVHASRYYMECLLDKLALHPSELASIINVQDVVGDTALIIAARVGNKKVVRLLLEAGADSKIRNKSGQNADEFLQEVEAQGSGSSSTLLPSLQPPPSTAAHLQQQQQQQQQQQSSHHRQQQQQPQGSPRPYHQPHFGNNNTSNNPLNNSSGSSNAGHPQRMSHTVSQQPHHPPDQPTHGTFQDYSSSSSSSRNPFQSHSGPPLPPVGQSFGQPRPGPTHEPSPSGREGHGGQGGHTPLDGTRPAELGAPASLSGSSGSLGGGVRASQRMIPAVTELFEHLTQSYEKDLYEKEQDLLDARNLLHSIQSEVQDGHRAMDELRSKTMYLGQAEDQIRTLEGMIRQEIHLRQRLRLEDLVVQEEARLRRERDMEKERSGNGLVDSGRVLAMEREAEELRSNLGQLQQSRKEQVEQIVQLKSQQGKRRQEYKRLIALCCNVSIDEVDGLLGPLLNTLGNEDSVA
ncbi:hypothetical protein BGX29_012208 [Mortierella sp. GBA35]|nr:hypothetical protein BGX29_012208 [Mortierella sp. GBA35]